MLPPSFHWGLPANPLVCPLGLGFRSYGVKKDTADKCHRVSASIFWEEAQVWKVLSFLKVELASHYIYLFEQTATNVLAEKMSPNLLISLPPRVSDWPRDPDQFWRLTQLTHCLLPFSHIFMSKDLDRCGSLNDSGCSLIQRWGDSGNLAGVLQHGNRSLSPLSICWPSIIQYHSHQLLPDSTTRLYSAHSVCHPTSPWVMRVNQSSQRKSMWH